MEPRCAIIQHQLEAAALPMPPILNPLGYYPAPCQRGRSEFELANWQNPAAIFVTARPMPQQFSDSSDAQANQMNGAFGSDSAQNGDGRIKGHLGCIRHAEVIARPGAEDKPVNRRK